VSAAGAAAVIGGSADIALAIGCATYLANRVIDRLRVGAPQQRQPSPSVPDVPVQAVQQQEAARHAEAARLPAGGGKSPNGRERYNRERDSGLDPGQARDAAGIADRTAREYEAERLRKAAAPAAPGETVPLRETS
jgi:hypothetical protein